jgi:hypothetical protein
MIKKPLPFDLYEKYEIDPRRSSFIIEVENILESKINEIESYYTDQHYQIVTIDIMRAHNQFLNLRLVVIAPETFLK